MRQHLLSPAGEAALHAALSNTPLLGFDFDGTLAPIVTQPSQARVSVAVARRLELLAQRLPVAVITGRDVQDVAKRLSFTPQYIVGNHGAEDPSDAPRAEHLQRALDPLRERVRLQATALTAAGVVVEDKHLSIALHYRCAPDQERAQALITSLLDAPGEPTRTKVFGGKRVVNVMAHDAPDKADAVLAETKGRGDQGGRWDLVSSLADREDHARKICMCGRMAASPSIRFGLAMVTL